jgi:hypothetical protein
MTTQVACGRSNLVQELCKALNVDTETDLVSKVTISIDADGYLTVTTLKYLPESNLKELVTVIDKYNLQKYKEDDNA